MRHYSETELRVILKHQLQKRGDQARLARSLGFTPQFLNDVVNGRRAVTAELAAAMGYQRLAPQFVRRDLAAAKGFVEESAKPAAIESPAQLQVQTPQQDIFT